MNIIVCTSQNISNPKCIGEAEIGQRREPNNVRVRQRRYVRVFSVPKLTDCCCSTQHDEKLNVSLCKSRICAANVREDHSSTLIVYATVALAGVFSFPRFSFTPLLRSKLHRTFLFSARTKHILYMKSL